MFQSTPGPRAGRNPAADAVHRCGMRFNPRPAPGPGATGQRPGRRQAPQVSIHARPQGRAQPPPPSAGAPSTSVLNPRPAPGPGATLSTLERKTGMGCFNPRPAPGPGATWFSPIIVDLLGVFQSTPGPRAGQPVRRPRRNVPMPVSIPPGPRASATRETCPWKNRAAASFQSTPGPRAGRNPADMGAKLLAKVFQSTPGPRAGRNPGNGVRRRRFHSFNPRPAPGAGLPGSIPCLPCASPPAARFNPRPAPGPGKAAGCRSAMYQTGQHWFQATPGPRAGRNKCHSSSTAANGCFNPRPAPGPGATQAAPPRTSR